MDESLWENIRKNPGAAVFRRLCAVGYAVTLAVCFICDLVLFYALDWFWIVLASLALAFCFTNLPFLIRRERPAVCLGAASLWLLLLLLACWLNTGSRWLLGGCAITMTCLALPWSWWAIRRFYPRHVLPLCLAAFSVWVFVLLAVICFFDGGHWLFSLAYPIAAFCTVYLWLFFLVVRLLPAGPWLKTAACFLLTTFFIPLGSRLAAQLAPEQNAPALRDYFAWGHIFTRESVSGFSWINVLVFAIMLVVSLALLAAGAAAECRRRKKG